MRAKRWVEYCDNPDCNSSPQVVGPGFESFGYRLGRGSYDNESGGGPIPAVYVCSLPCLVPAVEHAIKRLAEDGPT